MPISSSQADPLTLENLHLTTIKRIFLIKRTFGCETALVGDLGPSCARFSSSWARLGCSFGALNASGWQVRFPRIPPYVHKSKFNSQTSVFQKSPSSQREIEVFESGGGNPDFHNLLGRPPYTVFYDGFWHFARVRLRNRFIPLMSTLLLAHYLTVFFQIVAFPYLGPSRCRFGPPKRALQHSETE